MSFLDSLGLLISPPSFPPLTLRGERGGDAGNATDRASSKASPAAGFVASAGLAAWKRISDANQALHAQRISHSDLRVDEKIKAAESYAHNTALLKAMRTMIESGKANTLEEAIAAIPGEHLRLQQEFWKKPIVNPGEVVTLAREAHLVGINGGILEVPAYGYPKSCRLVIGPKGGFVKTADGKVWRIMPNAKGHKIDLKGGVIDSYQLSQLTAGRDYLVDTGWGKSPIKGDARKQDYLEGVKLKFEDPDLSALYQLETKAGLKRMTTPADRQRELLAVAKQLRHRNGSYAIATEILTGILKDAAWKTDDPVAKEAWEIYKSMTNAGGDWYRFSDAEKDGLVDFAFDTAVTMPLFMGAAGATRAALSSTKIAGRLGVGVIGKEIGKQGVQKGIKEVVAREGVKGLARMGATDLAILGASGAAGDIAVQSSKSGLVGSEFHLKQVGWGAATYVGFHLGGASWGQVAKRLEIRPVLKGVGTLGTQTVMDTSVGYLQEPGGDTPLAKRLLTSAIKMGGMHWGTALASGAGKVTLPSVQGVRTHFGRFALASPLTWMFLGAEGVGGPPGSSRSRRVPVTQIQIKVPSKPPRESPHLRSTIDRERPIVPEKQADGTFVVDKHYLFTRGEDGSWSITDRRNPSEISRHHLDPSRAGDCLDVPRAKMPLTVDGQFVEPGTPVRLGPHAMIQIGGLPHWFVVREPSSHALGSLNEPIQKAADFSEVTRILKESGVEGSLREIQRLEDCLAGRETTDILSPPVAKKVRELMAREADRLSVVPGKGILTDLASDHFLSTGTPIERRYHAVRATLDLAKKIGKARSIDDLREALNSSPLRDIDGNPLDYVRETIEKYEKGEIPLQSLPRQLRQKVREIEEAQIYALHEKKGVVVFAEKPEVVAVMRALEARETGLYGQVLTLGAEIGPSVRQVLARGAPLETVTEAGGVRGLVEKHMEEVVRVSQKHYPEDWGRTDHRNYFTGESFSGKGTHGIQAQYRFARMLLNLKTGRPIFGRPSKAEETNLVGFVKDKLSHGDVNDYPSAQKTIRDHMERFSPEIVRALEGADPATRALVIESFFGVFQHRQFSNPHDAFRLVRFLGQTGFYREVGVTIQKEGTGLYTNVSLGDMASVSPEGNYIFFVLHTHPEIYESGEGKMAGGGLTGTVGLADARPIRETTGVLFSRQDVRLYVHDAQRLGQYPSGGLEDFSIIYDKSQRVYKNWVVHPYGLSEIQVHLDLQGKPSWAEIRYAVSPKEGLNEGHRAQADKLREKMSVELGLPVTVKKVDESILLSSLPYEKPSGGGTLGGGVPPAPVVIPPAPPRAPRRPLGFFARLGLMAMSTGGLGAFVPAARKKPGPVGVILPPPLPEGVPPIKMPARDRLPAGLLGERGPFDAMPNGVAGFLEGFNEGLSVEPGPATLKPPVAIPAPELLPSPPLRVIEIPAGRTRTFLSKGGWADGVPVLQGPKIVVFQAQRVKNPVPMTPEAERLFGELDRNTRSHRIPRRFRIRIKMLENIYLASSPKTRQKIEQIIEVVNDINGGTRRAKSSREALPLLATMRELLDGAIAKYGVPVVEVTVPADVPIVAPEAAKGGLVIEPLPPFAKWMAALKDPTATVLIQQRIERVQGGNFGDVKPVGEGVYEMRVNNGPGYRIYYGLVDGKVIILLAGDKGTQDGDITKAVKMFGDYRRGT